MVADPPDPTSSPPPIAVIAVGERGAAITRRLGAAGMKALHHSVAESGWRLLPVRAGLAIVDLELVTLGRLRRLADDPETPPILVMIDEDDEVLRARILAAGGAAVVSWDAPDAQLVQIASAQMAAKRGASVDPVRHLPLSLSDFASQAPRMQDFVELVRKVMNSEATLLITGETGVGKEHLARAIHAESKPADAPFIDINCGAIPEHLLEDELFGHEAGAFTGAQKARRGRFEQAEGGTLFLDEIGDMPQHLQVKLLTVLQRHEITRLGGERTFKVDLRIIAATNRDLAEDVRAGVFREDLYYRLKVIELLIPSLRDRREDLPGLISRHIHTFSKRLGRPDVQGTSREAMQALLRHDWPGNVRELINVIERGVLLCEGTRLTRADLPAAIAGAPEVAVEAVLPPAAGETTGVPLPAGWLDLPLHELRESVMERLERAYFSGLLQKTGGNIGETAQRASLAPRSLYDKMKRLGLSKESFRL